LTYSQQLASDLLLSARSVRSFAATLKRQRRKCGITQTQLGDRIGTAQGRISDYECGRFLPDTSTLLRIHAALDHISAQGQAEEFSQYSVDFAE